LKLPHPLLLLAVGGCSSIGNPLTYDYAFDPRTTTATAGDGKTMSTLPTAACTPGATPDPCAMVGARLPAGSGTVACDANAKQCVATLAISQAQTIDLSKAQTPLPDAVLRFGISKVEIGKIAYWVGANSLNVATPPLQVFVAAQGAKDSHDPSAVQLGTVASLPAMSTSCADPADPKGDPAAGAAHVCDVPLTAAGQTALSGFVQNFRTPFALIVETTLVAKGGDPVPSGTLTVTVRPTVTFDLLK
jgi:hypothetical protein